MLWLRQLFARRDASQGRLEQRIHHLADLYIEVGVEVAEIKALLHHGKNVELTPDLLKLLSIEERISLLVKSQQHLAREVLDLKAILSVDADNPDCAAGCDPRRRSHC